MANRPDTGSEIWSNFLLPQTFQGFFLYMNALTPDTGWGWSFSLRSMLREALLTRLLKISNSTLPPPLTLLHLFLALPPPAIISCIYLFVVCLLSLSQGQGCGYFLHYPSPGPTTCWTTVDSEEIICGGTEWMVSWANEELCTILREKVGMLVFENDFSGWRVWALC